MKRFSQIVFSSALALMAFAPVFADAAPHKKCSIDDKEVLNLILSIDKTVLVMQQDLYSYGHQKELQNGIQKVIQAVNHLHKDLGKRAIEEKELYLNREFDELKKAASEYYKMVYDRMDGDKIQHAYDLTWLLTESEKVFEDQCKTPGNKGKKVHHWNNSSKFPVDDNRKPGHAVNPNGRGDKNSNHQAHIGGPKPPAHDLKPVDETIFLSIRAQLRRCNYTNELKNMLESIAPYHHFSMEQLRTLLTDQITEEKRLLVFEHIFPRVIGDRSNWFTFYELFTYSASKDKVKQIAEANLQINISLML